MKTIFKLFFVLILFYPHLLSCQNNLISNHKEIREYCGGRVATSMIFGYDKALLLDHDFISQDTIETCLINGIHWFRWKLKARKWDEERSVELFAFDCKNKILKQITSDDLYWVNAYPGTTDEIYLYKMKMFTLSRSDLIVIDNEKLEVQKRIRIFKYSSVNKLSESNNFLKLVIQPYRRERNYSYYLFFWLPKNKHNKWDYSKDGTPWEFVFDDDINLVNKEIIAQ